MSQAERVAPTVARQEGRRGGERAVAADLTLMSDDG